LRLRLLSESKLVISQARQRLKHAQSWACRKRSCKAYQCLIQGVSKCALFIVSERVKRGMSMTLLAQRAGLSQSMISFVEREIRNPSLETLLRIAEVFELNLGEIIQRAYKAAAKSK